jgi:hypothetical protein
LPRSREGWGDASFSHKPAFRSRNAGWHRAKAEQQMAQQPRKISRKQALDARPVLSPVRHRVSLEGGAARFTIEVSNSRWRQRLLRMPPTLDRQFEFDSFGVWVLEMCDGQKPVRHIVDRFAKEQNVDPAEAERAVTTFIQMLVRKNLVGLYIPKHKMP